MIKLFKKKTTEVLQASQHYNQIILLKTSQLKYLFFNIQTPHTCIKYEKFLPFPLDAEDFNGSLCFGSDIFVCLQQQLYQ